MGPTISSGGIWLPIEAPDGCQHGQPPVGNKRDRSQNLHLHHPREDQNSGVADFHHGGKEREAN